MFSSSKKLTNSTLNILKLEYNSSTTSLLAQNTISFFKRSISFEQKIVAAVNSLNANLVNNITYDIIFDKTNITEKKGYLTNFADKQIQSLPKNIYSFRKALNPSSFFADNPHLNVSVNPNDFSSIQQLNQRTNGICEVLGAQAIQRTNSNETVVLTHGNIKNPQLAYKQTNQWNSDYFCAKVLYKGKVYTYYADLKITDKNAFLAKISSLHPNKLILCQVYIVGGIDDSFVFNSHTKNSLIIGCTDYMAQHIADNTIISQCQYQLIKELQTFDSNPTVYNYNALVVAPWRIFTVPSLIKIFNA